MFVCSCVMGMCLVVSLGWLFVVWLFGCFIFVYLVGVLCLLCLFSWLDWLLIFASFVFGILLIWRFGFVVLGLLFVWCFVGLVFCYEFVLVLV